MNSKQVLQNALNHKSGKIPIDFGSTAVTGIHVRCVAALRDHYGLEKSPVKVHEPYQMLGWIDEDLKDAMGIDTDGLFPRNTMFGFPNENWKPWKTYEGLEVLVSEHFKTTIDEEGDTYIYPQGDTSAPPSAKMPKDGYFFDTIIRQEPLDEDELNPEDNLEEFQLVTKDDIQHYVKQIKEYKDSGRGLVSTFAGTAFGDIALVPAPFLKHPKGIRDISEWYISTKTRQAYIHEVFTHQCETALQNLETFHNILGDMIDAVFLCGTDFGTQTSTFCSEEVFRSLYLPYYKKLTDWIHKNTAWKCFKHSCGAVENFMEAFIDCGFDIINPVQCSAKGMEPELLKKKYGDRFVFWGGGVETQKELSFGTPDQVRDQVLRRCEIFSEGGGFVFNTVHNIQGNTPIENIVAMLDAVHEFNGGK